MKKITLKIKLTLVAPFLTKSTDVGAFGLDYPLARNEDGKFFFPKKLIKGCLKQAWNEIADVSNSFSLNDIDEWLGKKSKFENEEDLTTVQPVRGKIYFSDFITDQTGDDGVITRISIDEARGAVDEGALLVIESPFKPQEQVEFIGKIIYFAEDNDWQKIKNRLLKGLDWITNLGALENINFGKLMKVEITNEGSAEECKEVNLTPNSASGAEFLDLIITPQEPFCISKRRTTENLFESEIFIPGGVIKGCLAETLKLINPDETAFNELRANLHLIRFTHAFPSKDNVRPVVAPLSLVKIKSDKNESDFTKKYNDVWESKNAILIHDEAPEFSVDWKDSSDVEKHFGWEKLKTILSVQTAIENNKAKDGQLYGYEKINPKDFQWLGRIDLSRITDDTVEGQLRRVLAQDLFGLGKTKALAKAEVFAENTIENKFNKRVKVPPEKLIITLQTPFLLCNPQNLNEYSGKTELLKKYKETWEELFKNSATLSHFFASQSLAGGEYLYKRFQSNNSYNPFILTDAGSVFVFDVTDQTKADNKIDDWLKHGLPLPDWAETLYGNNWETCPFLPENGFGEIAVNLEVHWDNAPQPTEVTVI